VTLRPLGNQWKSRAVHVLSAAVLVYVLGGSPGGTPEQLVYEDAYEYVYGNN